MSRASVQRMWTRTVAWLGLAVGAAIVGSACASPEPTIEDTEGDVGSAEESQVRIDTRRIGCASRLRRYVSRSRASCDAIRFYCPEGTPFSDQCGCGCLVVPRRPGPPGGPPFAGERCGPTVCEPGMVCCNASCGICTPPGGACIQIVCD